jgi:hypothetical protein
MLVELEGRLKWKRTSRGILIVIPARRSGMIALYSPLVVTWLVLATIHYWHLLAAPHLAGSEFTFQMIAIGIYALGFCFFVCWLAWILTNDTVVTLDPDEMKIQHRVMGIDVATFRFRTRETSGLRYVPPERFWAHKNDVDPKTSKIQFQCGGKAHTLTSGVTETEASALIARMQTFQWFPDSPKPHDANIGQR